MQIYLVGGAVRDQLLGLPISDRDWVVVGATKNDLIKLGFQQIGKDFPVFLHSQTREEYALARTERKSGIGHIGFSFCTNQYVTIEEDLLRRDLTINAIAQSKDGRLIDPFNGKDDIKNRILRHVSYAFIEDPLRIFRVARFAARLAPQNFTIANETKLLMKKIILNYEINEISAERIWEETEKALQSSSPEIYFQVLYDCGALNIIFPEINKLFGISKVTGFISKIDVGLHTLFALKIAASLTNDIEIRFAVLCHDFGEIFTKEENYSDNHNFFVHVYTLIDVMCTRLRIPNRIKELAKLAARFHPLIHNINKLKPDIVVKLFDQLDCWRKPERIYQLAIVCEADFRGWLGREHFFYSQGQFMIEAFKILKQISSKHFIKHGMQGIEIRDKLIKIRIQVYTEWRKQQNILPI
ncbi:Multifunctional CCA protein [Candidatus Arsenophonus lipoptenae]|uniref:CCA-adding enzyme n=1 Tax=Candidatus Arsenophonus lipoptenae TaxID=634113 RepID=A0A109QE58_9GAMM|nr:multifunctional CCA addition/repair protein [Candidatus Arsenophonus lipoptenae]AMA65021.1 Multifunctional CCA protein [Candidatus Arsenophonus lipoptenae]